MSSTTRASFAVHNTAADVDRLIDGLGVGPPGAPAGLSCDCQAGGAHRCSIRRHFQIASATSHVIANSPTTA